MERMSKRNQMTINKWLMCIPTVFLMTSAPTLYGQDFLKQLEAKLFQKQQESKTKEQLPAANPSTQEAAENPFELPSVLEPDSLPKPGLLKPKEESESLELPAPKADRKGPSTQRSAKPNPSTTDNALSKASGPVQSPFPRALPKSPASLSTGGGGFLGLTVESIPGGGFGLTVVEVAADSPAWKAGFRNGDKVIGVSGQAVSTVDAFAQQLTRFAPGAPVKFLVDRRGKTANLVAVLQDRTIAGQIHGLRPGTAAELEPGLTPVAGNRTGQAYFGINVSDMSDAYRRQFGIPAYRGASVTEVVPNSPAHSAGLKPGDCIVEIEGATVQSGEVVLDTILRSKPGQVISVSYYRGRQLNSVSVALASDQDNGGRTPTSISPEMLTPEYVANLQTELERVHSELSETQARLQQLEARLQRIENKR